MKKILATLFSVIIVSIVLAQGGGGPANPCRACFPNSNGHAGEYLQTNGMGGLSWQPGGGVGTSYWDTTGGVFQNTVTSLPVVISSSAIAGRLRLDGTGVTVSNSYTLPTADGSAGQVITTDGSGVLNWGSVGWGLTGNAGTNPATDFLGTTDHKALVIKTNDSLTITQDGRYIINDTVTHTQVGIYNAKRTGVRGWCAERFNGTTMFNSYLQETDVDKQTGGMGAFDTAKLCRASISVGHENGEYFAQVQYGYGGADTSLRNELIADSLGLKVELQNAAVATTFQVDNHNETIFGVRNNGQYYFPVGATDGYILKVDGDGFATWTSPSSIDYSSVPAYANNAAAVAGIAITCSCSGLGKLYYTDVAGEYILKVTH